MLHSTVPPELQRRVLNVTPENHWKIILSTNIAESSITIGDVTHVVDCGLSREMNFDPATSMSSLCTVFASRSSMQQRAGRAGRVTAGHCWRMFTQDAIATPAISEYSLPEIVRVPLEDAILQVCVCLGMVLV